MAVRVGTVLDYLFSDHLPLSLRFRDATRGSTSTTADSSGNLAGGMRYTAWGETRFSGGATPTSFRYTGQRQAEAGLYFYVARMYDPALGRFISPDSMVSGAGNPQAYDRFGYALNNPVLYNDPTGHDVGRGQYPIMRDEFDHPWVPITLAAIMPASRQNPFSSSHSLSSSPNYPLNLPNGAGCKASLPDCFGDKVTLKDFSGNGKDNPISSKEFKQFSDKVADDLYSHDTDWPGLNGGRAVYDTPFYNGGESDKRGGAGATKGFYPSNQQVCIEALRCSGRSEINYIAQGMWGARSGEPKIVSELITVIWKLEEYRQLPSEDTMYWLDFGYEYYQQWKKENHK